MMSQYPSTGMVTTSPTNPLDEIPIGPQIFPYGTPTVAESRVEPYQSTNYQQGVTQIQSTDTYPSTTYQTLGDATTYTSEYQTTDAIPLTNYGESVITNYQTTEVLPSTNIETVQQGVYDLGAYQTTEYQNLVTPAVSTGYKTVVRYKPVTKTVYVPQVTTKYVPVPVDSETSGVINPAIPTPNPIIQQSLTNPQTVPLPAPVQAPAMSILPPPLAMPAPPAPMPGDTHFIKNYPIYENDPRRIAGSLAINPSTVQALNNANLSTSITPVGVVPSQGVGLGLNTGNLGGLNTGLNTTNLGGLNQLNNIGTGLNTLGSVGTGLNNLGTGLNNLGSVDTGLNNLGNVGTGLNNLGTGLRIK